jgi:hypothetical protein
MTLEASSAAALEAARARDLDALAVALEARTAALQRGELPTPGVHAAGELTAQLLRALIQEAGLECARLTQLSQAFQPRAAPNLIDLEG